MRENEKISKEDKETISENITSIKQERRRQILLENGIALEEDDDPKVELEKAFYYHKITEKKFETKAKELGETFERLEQRIYKGEVIQDLQNDVISMPENEIENISRNLDLKYGLKTFLKEEKEG